MSTVTNQIIAKLRERILTGGYSPGTHLQEAKTAADLAVSRTPIREAFRVLANEDLLIYSPNRGYIVRGVELKDVLDAYDVRGALDGLAARLIAENGIARGTHQQFEKVLERGDQVLASETWGPEQHHAMFEMNQEFYRILLEGSDNAYLEAAMRPLRRAPRLFDSRLEPESEFFQRAYTRERWAQAHKDYHQIVTAILRREGARAEALARGHVYTDREILREGVERDLVHVERQAAKSVGAPEVLRRRTASRRP